MKTELLAATIRKASIDALYDAREGGKVMDQAAIDVSIEVLEAIAGEFEEKAETGVGHIDDAAKICRNTAESLRKSR